MKIFLSGLEAETKHIFEKLEREGDKLEFGLVSYFYIRKNPEMFDLIKRNTRELLVDSGAHTFQKGTAVNWGDYTKEYAEWIKKNDAPNILGYFEMDVDVAIGYENVLKLREILDAVTRKVIPVWHKNRGVNEFKKMCQSEKHPIVAITGFRNEDIKDDQYGAFLKYAWEHNKKVHCLGMTRVKVLEKVPFDFVDSSSWKQTGVYGSVKLFNKGKLVNRNVKGLYKTKELSEINFEEFRKFARYYNRKWAKITHDLCVMLRFGISRLIKTKERNINESKRNDKNVNDRCIIRSNHFFACSDKFWSNSGATSRSIQSPCIV